MEIKLEQGDITRYRVDAIVNAANKSLLGGGGVDGAIHRAAGERLLEYCRTLGGCETGEAKITPGFNLPARFVIHTPGPIYRFYRNPELADQALRSCYWNSLRLAEENNCETIAFPSIATGIYAFPLDRAAKIALGTIREFGNTQAKSLRCATMVLFDQRTYDAYAKAFQNESED